MSYQINRKHETTAPFITEIINNYILLLYKRKVIFIDARNGQIVKKFKFNIGLTNVKDYYLKEGYIFIVDNRGLFILRFNYRRLSLYLARVYNKEINAICFDGPFMYLAEDEYWVNLYHVNGKYIKYIGNVFYSEYPRLCCLGNPDCPHNDEYYEEEICKIYIDEKLTIQTANKKTRINIPEDLYSQYYSAEKTRQLLTNYNSAFLDIFDFIVDEYIF